MRPKGILDQENGFSQGRIWSLAGCGVKLGINLAGSTRILNVT
jgi:hypothetical protein